MARKTFTATDGVSRCVYTWSLGADGAVESFDVALPDKPVFPDLLAHQTRYALGKDGTKFLLEFGAFGAPPLVSEIQEVAATKLEDNPDTPPPDSKKPGFAYKVSDEELEFLISKYGKDLTRMSREGRLDPVIGRDEEVELVTTVLLQRGRSNVAVLGEAGVGKTALFVATAHAFAEDRVMGRLKGGRVIEMDISAMGAGTGSKEEMEGRLLPFVQGVAERNEANVTPPIVLCIDEIHSHLSAGSLGAAETLKPYLTAGHLLTIGATTRDEYDRYIRKDEALDRRFQKIELDAPNLEQSITILQGLRPRFEKFHKIKISDKMIERIVYLADKYMSKARQQPDKSIMMMDASCARAIKMGETEELKDEHVRRAVAAEVGINPNAVD